MTNYSKQTYKMSKTLFRIFLDKDENSLNISWNPMNSTIVFMPMPIIILDPFYHYQLPKQLSFEFKDETFFELRDQHDKGLCILNTQFFCIVLIQIFENRPIQNYFFGDSRWGRRRINFRRSQPRSTKSKSGWSQRWSVIGAWRGMCFMSTKQQCLKLVAPPQLDSGSGQGFERCLGRVFVRGPFDVCDLRCTRAPVLNRDGAFATGAYRIVPTTTVLTKPILCSNMPIFRRLWHLVKVTPGFSLYKP